MESLKLLTADQVAEILQVDRDRMYELAKRGLLPSVRVGRQIRFSQQAIANWIAEGGKALAGGWRREPAGIA